MQSISMRIDELQPGVESIVQDGAYIMIYLENEVYRLLPEEIEIFLSLRLKGIAQGKKANTPGAHSSLRQPEKAGTWHRTT